MLVDLVVRDWLFDALVVAMVVIDSWLCVVVMVWVDFYDWFLLYLVIGALVEEGSFLLAFLGLGELEWVMLILVVCIGVWFEFVLVVELVVDVMN